MIAAYLNCSQVLSSTKYKRRGRSTANTFRMRVEDSSKVGATLRQSAERQVRQVPPRHCRMTSTAHDRARLWDRADGGKDGRGLEVDNDHEILQKNKL